MESIFKVGDRVFSIHYGWGEVNEKIYNDDEHDFYVAFKTKSQLVEVAYTKDGREYDVEQPTLSFTEYTLQGFSQERPIVLPEVGELCLFRRCDTDKWFVGNFKKYKDGLYYSELHYWEQCKRIKILD